MPVCRLLLRERRARYRTAFRRYRSLLGLRLCCLNRDGRLRALEKRTLGVDLAIRLAVGDKVALATSDGDAAVRRAQYTSATER